MAIDMSKVQQLKTRLTQELSRGGNGGLSAKFWRPDDGDNIIRIMPAWTTEEPFAGQFWREVSQHWGLSEDQKGPVICPQQTPGLDEVCPVCTFVEELKKDKNSAKSIELAKEIRAKKAYLLNIVDNSDPMYTAKDVAEYKKLRPDNDVPFEAGNPKIQVYACPKTIFDMILNCIMTNDADITDLQQGNDVTINKTGKGIQGTRYSVTPKLKSTASDVSVSDTLPALDRVGYVMSGPDLISMLTDGVGGDYTALLPSDTAAAPPSKVVNRHKASDDDLETQMSRALRA